ncbi:MAG TPA: MBL fold metallo-hydrolase [Candidatus Acidoferrales bacterium]|jgi:ribonuclease BN (tRNA processing enzyme)|nr:MBL fold metallo-hydrolase [Candidatus Acidoferrales bacterium]
MEPFDDPICCGGAVHDRTPKLDRARFLSSAAGAAAGLAAFQTAPGTTGIPIPSALAAGANQLVILGTAAGPPPVPGLTGISTALKLGDRVYVIDCGRSSVTQYANAKLGFTNLAGIFITHLHADHVCDLWNFFLLGAGWASPTDSLRKAIPVYGPASPGLPLPPAYPPGRQVPTAVPANPVPGIKTLVDRCNEAFAYSTNVLVRDSGIMDLRRLADVREIPLPNAGAKPLGPTAPPMKPVTIAQLPDCTVTGILVEHGICFPSYAFRFDTEGGSVVFSGDTALCSNMVTLAKGADVLVHEAVDLQYFKDHGYSSTLLAHLKGSHTDIGDVASVAQAAGVPRVIVTHLAPGGLVTTAQWLAGAKQGAKKAGYTGQIGIAEDLAVYDLRG